MTPNIKKINALFGDLVPSSGKCDFLAGEMVRAAARIGYRFVNDGDRIGIGYGKETCNAAARFLIQKAPKEIADLTAALWGMASENDYRAGLDVLAGKVADYVNAHPELCEEPTDDMFSYFDKFEDVDDSYDDDDCEEEWA